MDSYVGKNRWNNWFELDALEQQYPVLNRFLVILSKQRASGIVSYFSYSIFAKSFFSQSLFSKTYAKDKRNHFVYLHLNEFIYIHKHFLMPLKKMSNANRKNTQTPVNIHLFQYIYIRVLFVTSFVEKLQSVCERRR